MSSLSVYSWVDAPHAVDVLHANHVLTKALRDFCDGRVTAKQLKDWFEGADTPIVRSPQGETK